MATQLGLGASTVKRELRWLDDKRMVKPSHLGAFVEWAKAAPELVLDYEADGNRPYRGDRPFMAGFYAPDKGAKILELRLLGDAGHAALKDALVGRRGVTIGHGLSYECAMTQALGYEIGGTLWCNHAASFALDERGDHGQKELVEQLLKRPTPQAASLRDWMATNLGGHKRGHEENPLELELPYNAEDVSDCWDLYRHLRPLVERAGMVELVQTDSELSRTVAEMENSPLRLDIPAAEQLLAELNKGLHDAYNAIREAVGRPVDIGSHTSLFGLLYGEFKLPQHKDIEKAGRLDDDVLKWFLTLLKAESKEARVVTSIRDWRDYDKLKGTYVLPWLHEHSYKGAIYPHLNMYIARTRRFTADDPNMQNVPARTELGRQVRALILGFEGGATHVWDYSQIEYRAFGHYSNAPLLIRGYQNDPMFDMHKWTGSLCGVDRDSGKHLNFGLLFGLGKDKLARKLLVQVEQADALKKKYMDRVPEIPRMRRELEAQVRNKGYVSDMYHGRRHLKPDEAYSALNTLCQMTAANLIRRAMVAVRPIVKRLGGRMLLTIHDELQAGLPGAAQDNKQNVAELTQVMRDAGAKWRVPTVAEHEYYDTNWAEKKELA